MQEKYEFLKVNDDREIEFINLLTKAMHAPLDFTIEDNERVKELIQAAVPIPRLG